MPGTEVIDTIARALHEDAEGPRQRITEIVQAIGETTALQLLAETERIENSGGELVKKGSRRRTPGGVFFRLAKASVTTEARRTIFRSPHKPKPKQEQPARATTAQKAAQPQRGSAPQSPRTPPQSAPETVVVRPRRRVVELGSIRQPEPPKPPPPPQKPQGGWTRPTSSRSAAAGVAENVGRERQRDSERVPVAVPVVSPPKPPAPASDVDAVKRIRDLFQKLDRTQARELVGELYEQFAPESRPPPATDPDELEATGEETRERVLSAVVEALSLDARDLARVLYGDESPSAIRRAQKTLENKRSR